MSSSFWLRNSGATLALVVNVTACGGGGGGGGSATTTPSSTPVSAPVTQTLTIPGPTPVTPALYPNIFTSEYYGNYGLDIVHAGNAYVAGLTGTGVTVAIIDDGVANIPKLQNQISQQINLTSSQSVTDFHGTSVASVLAAISDGNFMHGIAYGAKIVDIRANVSGEFSSTTLQTALNIAAGQNTTYGTVNASIINLSLGGSLSSALQAGLVAAVNAGKLIVMAAGNDGTASTPATNPEASALFATQAAAKGQVIIAGALTKAGTIATYSNLAGSGAAYYLLAPGDNIATYDNTGAKITASGTSYAVPMIAGGAAILEQEFPNLTAAKVVQILLTTADPLPTGNSSTYGAGVMDLAKAIQPIGTLSVPLGTTTAGSVTAMSTSTVIMASSFGTSLPASLTGKAVLTLDSFQRGYMVNLFSSFHTVHETPDYQDGFINPESMISAATKQLKAFETDTNPLNPASFAIVPSSTSKPIGMDIALALKGGTVAEIAQHATPMNLITASLPDPLGSNDAGEPLFMRGQLTVLPQASFVTDGYGGAISHRFSQGAVTIAAMWNNANIDNYASPYQNPTNSLLQISGGTSIANIDFGLSVGRLLENNRTFGTISTGALQLGSGASTTFLTMLGKTYLTERLELNFAYTEGYTGANKANGLFTHLDTITSNSFAVGMIEHSGFVSGDSLGLQVAQPIRVSNANANLLLPVALDMNGNIYRSATSINLAPQGREIDMQLAYSAKLAKLNSSFRNSGNIQAFLMARFNPGHDSTAGTDYGGGLRWKLTL